MYNTHKSQRELNSDLLVGMKKQLIKSSDTSVSKQDRLTSLSNMEEVLTYVLLHPNEAIPDDEIAILSRFFNLLLIKIVKAKISIHSKPEIYTGNSISFSAYQFTVNLRKNKNRRSSHK